jgi:hypothetical protein
MEIFVSLLQTINYDGRIKIIFFDEVMCLFKLASNERTDPRTTFQFGEITLYLTQRRIAPGGGFLLVCDAFVHLA